MKVAGVNHKKLPPRTPGPFRITKSQLHTTVIDENGTPITMSIHRKTTKSEPKSNRHAQKPRSAQRSDKLQTASKTPRQQNHQATKHVGSKARLQEKYAVVNG